MTKKAAPTPPAPNPAPGEGTLVILAFDESDSMQTQVPHINAQAEAIRSRLVAELPAATVEVLRFGTTLAWDSPTKATLLPPVLLGHGRCRTALLSALHGASTKATVAVRSGTRSALVYLLTDGGENESHRYGVTPPATRMAVEAALATDRVTFACVGPQEAATFFLQCGIPEACVRRWDGDSRDLQVVTQQAAQGVTQYAAARKAGRTKVESFFVDADGLTLDVVAKACADVTSSMRVKTVAKDERIQEYIIATLKRPFLFGAGYYQLVRPERLAKGRAIVARHRDDPRLWKGPRLRELLGLPEDRDVRVTPGSLGKWTLFVQSASPNRKLVARTDFLFDESHTGGTEATWTDVKATTAA